MFFVAGIRDDEKLSSMARKSSKVLTMFQVTRFPNDRCTVAGTAVREIFFEAKNKL